MKTKFILYIIFLLIFTSCKSEYDDFTLEEGRFYYPIEVGLNTTFKIDSTIYNPFQQLIIEKSFYVREFIESTYIDDAGNTNYRLERYTGETDSTTNKLASVWYVSVGKKSIDRVEDNLRFRKMIFPALENASWQAHKFIYENELLSYLKNWKYNYTTINKPFQLTDLTFANKDFDSTITIRQIGDSSNITQAKGKEVYAKNIGLVFREMTYLDGSTPCRRLCPSQSEACVNDCFKLPLSVRADNGYIVTIRYIKHEVLP